MDGRRRRRRRHGVKRQVFRKDETVCLLVFIHFIPTDPPLNLRPPWVSTSTSPVSSRQHHKPNRPPQAHGGTQLRVWLALPHSPHSLLPPPFITHASHHTHAPHPNALSLGTRSPSLARPSPPHNHPLLHLLRHPGRKRRDEKEMRKGTKRKKKDIKITHPLDPVRQRSAAPRNALDQTNPRSNPLDPSARPLVRPPRPHTPTTPPRHKQKNHRHASPDTSQCPCPTPLPRHAMPCKTTKNAPPAPSVPRAKTG